MRVVVVGATGALGLATVQEAARRGHSVRAFARHPERCQWPDGVEVVRGDASDAVAIGPACRDAEVVFYTVNLPLPEWKQRLIPTLQSAAAACREAGARLVFPANVWIYGPGRAGDLVDERRPASPTSKKGALRAQAEATLRADGVRYAMVRLPEFYGPNLTNQLMGAPFRDALAGRSLTWYGGHLDVTVEYVFIEDAARAFVEVGTADDCDGQVYHVPGAGPITPREFMTKVITQAGTDAKLHDVPEFGTRLVGLVNAQAREFADILHLWSHPILLDGSRYLKRFGAVPRTAYDEGIARTLQWFREHPDATGLN